MSNGPIAEIKNIISSVLEIDKGVINDEFSPDQVDYWDSMNHMKIIVSLEREYGIIFEADQIPEMVNFEKICTAVIGKL